MKTVLGMAMQLGADEFPEAFEKAQNFLLHYEAECGAMTEKERYDFRRGFEIGYYFAKTTQPKAASGGGTTKEQHENTF